MAPDISTVLAVCNSELLVAATSSRLDDHAMPKNLASVRETRRVKLSALLDEYGQGALSELTGIAPAYLWQMGKGEGPQKRGVSDSNAELIERKLGKPPGWMSGEISSGGDSQAVRFDDATMSQAVDLLYLMADARPEDRNFHRFNWAMILIAAKGVEQADGDPRKAMAYILAELAKEI